MEGHGANLTDVVIGNDVVLPRLAALARADFERQNGIGDLLDYAGAAGVVTNTVKINAHVFADVCLENIAQLPIHPLRTNCVHPARLANQLFLSSPLTALLRGHQSSITLTSVRSLIGG